MEFCEIVRRLNIVRPLRVKLQINLNKDRECLKQREQDLKELDLLIEKLEFSLNKIIGEMKNE